MSVQNTLSVAGAQSPVSHEDIARVLGRYCLIRLDNGAESFWHNGHYVCEADGASAEAGVSDIARLAARAGGQSLRHAELPVPDGEWCWSDIAERLAGARVRHRDRMRNAAGPGRAFLRPSAAQR